MPRQLIKTRGFQEPIHEDAPGFDEELGHKNLITELNEEVLPSWITDLVGPFDADSSEYQLRRNAAGVLEFYDASTSEWVALAGAGGPGGGGDESYNPTHYATVQVDSPLTTDAFASVDLVTDESFGGRDIRVYQYGLRKRHIIRNLGPDEVSGKPTYRIMFEGIFTQGLNEFEIRYGDMYAPWASISDWSLEENMEFIRAPVDQHDLRYAIMRYDELPVWLPFPETIDESGLATAFPHIFNGSTTSNITIADNKYWDNVNEVWSDPVFSPSAFRIDGVASNPSYPGYNDPAYNLGYRRYHATNYSNYLYSIGANASPAGPLYMIAHQVRYGSGRAWSERSADMIGLLTNGWIIFTTYYDGSYNRTRAGMWYRTGGSEYVQFNATARTDWNTDPPELFALVPILSPARAEVTAVDQTP